MNINNNNNNNNNNKNNQNMKPNDNDFNTTDSAGNGNDTESFRTIGILDIFGFEDLTVNSFEQLCINYCNERLHHYYNEECFRIEQKVYEQEGVHISGLNNIPFVDNADTLLLFEHKNFGIMKMMDTEIYTPGGNNSSFLDKIMMQHGDHPNFSRPSVRESRDSFKVHHYAGSVSYSTCDLLEKCRDFLHIDLEKVLTNSGDAFMEQIVNIRNRSKVNTANISNNARGRLSGTSSSSTAKTFGGGLQRRGSTGKQATLGVQFMLSLESLMKRLRQTTPHFVKCIKPNGKKSSELFVNISVMAQLRYSGLLSLCKLRQIGFPSRMLFEEFVKRFRAIVNQNHVHNNNKNNATTSSRSDNDTATVSLGSESIHVLVSRLCSMRILEPDCWLMGKARIFMKQIQIDKVEACLQSLQVTAVIIIQKKWRCYNLSNKYNILLSLIKQLRQLCSDNSKIDTNTNNNDKTDMRVHVSKLSQLIDTIQGHEFVVGGLVTVLDLERAILIKTRCEEEVVAIDMLSTAIQNRDSTALNHALAFAQRLGGFLKSHPKTLAAKSLVNRLDEEERVVGLVRAAILKRDAAALQAALNLDAAKEILMDRNGGPGAHGTATSIYEDINEGRIMLQRLLAESQLKREYEAALVKNDAQQIEVLVNEMAVFGMSVENITHKDTTTTSDDDSSIYNNNSGKSNSNANDTNDSDVRGLLSPNGTLSSTTGVMKLQHKAELDLLAAMEVYPSDFSLIHECMNAAINIGLQDHEVVRQAREKISHSSKVEKLIQHMVSVSSM